MKHPLPTTLILVFLFFAAQAVGLGLLFLDMDVDVIGGEPVVQHDDPIIGPRPDTTGGQSFLFIAIGVAIGTILLLVLIRLGAFRLWRYWFLLAVWLSVSVALGVLMPAAAAFVLAAIVAAWKVFRPNAVVHNLTEIFMYAGITILIAPLFDLRWAIMLLVAISAYDIIAVWYSKHMITMAKAQTERNLFAGLYVPKAAAPPKPVKHVVKAAETRSAPSGGVAILGGGDIAFPLIFSGAVLVWLIEGGTAPVIALYQTLLISLTTTAALLTLFWLAEKDRFYPAMPFLSAGCVIGLAIVALL